MHTPAMTRIRREWLEEIKDRGFADLYAAEFDCALAHEITAARIDERDLISEYLIHRSRQARLYSQDEGRGIEDCAHSIRNGNHLGRQQ